MEAARGNAVFGWRLRLPSVVLQVRVRNRSQVDAVEESLRSALDGLKVDLSFRSVGSPGWVGISVSGEDENVAVRYLEENVGLCPSSVEDVHRFSVLKGYVVNLLGCRDGLKIDVGVSSPEHVDFLIPLHVLQAQLADGRKVALAKLVELFGLCEGLPLEVRVSDLDSSSGFYKAQLAEMQVERFAFWTRSLLDRLLVVGASREEAEEAVEFSGLFRDIVEVDSLGFLEHALVCKLGTDAKGLISRVGRVLRKAGLTVFSARRVVDFLGEEAVSSVLW